MAGFSSAFAAALLLVAAPAAQAVVEHRARTGGHLASLEAKLQPIYDALPPGAHGLPEASSVRYLARRFMLSQHGWTVHGLDLRPQHPGANATILASLRAGQLLHVPSGLPQADAEAMEALRQAKPGRGFTLREAAQFVHAVEQVAANAHVVLMRKARALSRPLPAVGSKLHMLVATYAALHMAGTEGARFFTEGVRKAGPDRFLSQAIGELAARLKADKDSESLEAMVAASVREASATHNGAVRAMEAMRRVRERLDGRHPKECRRFHGILKSLDHEVTGQVQFAPAYGTNMQDWALLETPQYLRAVGALEEQGAKGVGPGFVIPNYVTSMNSCTDNGPDGVSVCCPDECELELLPRLEAAAGGPRATARQVWSVAQRAFKGQALLPVDKRKALLAELRKLAARAKDGRLAVHGQPLSQWLHNAFPQTCRKPSLPGAPPLVDPALSPTPWQKAGNYLPMDEAEVAVVRAHLQSRWGPDGTGTDITSFAARSSIGLDAELQLIQKFYPAWKAGGQPVPQALEDALNVRVREREGPLARHALAASAATAALGLLGLLLALVSAVLRLLAALAKAALGRTCATAGALTMRAWSAAGARAEDAKALFQNVCVRAGGAAAVPIAGFEAARATACELQAKLRSAAAQAQMPRRYAKEEPRASETEDSTDAGETDSDAAPEPSSDSEADAEASHALKKVHAPAPEPGSDSEADAEARHGHERVLAPGLESSSDCEADAEASRPLAKAPAPASEPGSDSEASTKASLGQEKSSAPAPEPGSDIKADAKANQGTAKVSKPAPYEASATAAPARRQNAEEAVASPERQAKLERLRPPPGLSAPIGRLSQGPMLAPSWHKSALKPEAAQAGATRLAPGWLRPAPKPEPQATSEAPLQPSWRSASWRAEPSRADEADGQLSWRRPALRPEAFGTRSKADESTNWRRDEPVSWHKPMPQEEGDGLDESASLMALVARQLKDM